MPVVLDPMMHRAAFEAPVDAPQPGGGAPPDQAGTGDVDDGGGGDDDGDDDPAPMSARGWVTLAAFWYPTQAHIARLRLEAAGIACVLVGEIAAATHVLNIATGGVKLQVPRAQYRRASRLLGRQSSGCLPGPRVTLAEYELLIQAKSAACVVESAGLWCEVVERPGPQEIPEWVRFLPRGMRARLWPSAALVVERDDLAAAAEALAPTPFAVGLTAAARAAGPGRHCGSCGATGEWKVWHLTWRPGTSPASPVRALLPRLARRCGKCGQEWGHSPATAT